MIHDRRWTRDDGRWKKQRRFRSYGIDRPENDDQEDAEFHDGKGPEFDGAKGNRGEEDKKNENGLNDMIDHNDSSRLKAESKINISYLKLN